LLKSKIVTDEAKRAGEENDRLVKHTKEAKIPPEVDLFDAYWSPLHSYDIMYTCSSSLQAPELKIEPSLSDSRTITQGIASGFPVSRRPEQRKLSTVTQDDIDKWFDSTDIQIREVTATGEQKNQVRRLLYTWKDCFVSRMWDVKPTDLIEHAIDLFPGSKPVFTRPHKYTQREREFAAQVFPQMEEAGIIYHGSSPWAAVTKFPPKKPGSDKMQVVHNFIPINACTIKPVYPMHNLEEVLDVLVKPTFVVFFSSDAANGYWAVPLRKGDEHKAAITAPNGQWLFRHMGQGLKGAPYTYSQFTDLVFGLLPRTDTVVSFPTLIGDHGDIGFVPFMDDHIGAAISFDTMYTFLHKKYFLWVAFGPLALSPAKSLFFFNSLDVIGFSASSDGLCPSVRHRNRVALWPRPTSKEEVEAFIWITLFLWVFIPGCADHVLVLKALYQHEVPIPLKSRKVSIRKKWAEKPFEWTDAQEVSF
jgi:hypothetical protein